MPVSHGHATPAMTRLEGAVAGPIPARSALRRDRRDNLVFRFQLRTLRVPGAAIPLVCRIASGRLQVARLPTKVDSLPITISTTNHIRQNDLPQIAALAFMGLKAS